MSNGYYTYRSKTGSNQNFTLASDAKATDGTSIVNDVDYRVFVVAVNNNSSQSSAISSASGVIKLASTSAVGAVTINDVVPKGADQAAGDASDIRVTYTKPNSEQGIRRYMIMVVPASTSFDLNTAKAAVTRGYSVQATSSPTDLPSTLSDSNGNPVKDGVPYKIVMLSESSDSKRESSITTSRTFTINPKSKHQHLLRR